MTMRNSAYMISLRFDGKGTACKSIVLQFTLSDLTSQSSISQDFWKRPHYIKNVTPEQQNKGKMGLKMRIFRIRFTTVPTSTSCKNFKDGDIFNFIEAAVFLENKKVVLFPLQSSEIELNGISVIRHGIPWLKS